MNEETLLQKVRLKDFELKAIIESFADLFLPGDHLWLFGSRADMTKRGGDIDLYIETYLSADIIYKTRMKFILALCSKIGDQKIDVVVRIMQDEVELPIYGIAKAEGVQLK
jgi:hypothetical protein